MRILSRIKHVIRSNAETWLALRLLVCYIVYKTGQAAIRDSLWSHSFDICNNLPAWLDVYKVQQNALPPSNTDKRMKSVFVKRTHDRWLYLLASIWNWNDCQDLSTDRCNTNHIAKQRNHCSSHAFSISWVAINTWCTPAHAHWCEYRSPSRRVAGKMWIQGGFTSSSSVAWSCMLLITTYNNRTIRIHLIAVVCR